MAHIREGKIAEMRGMPNMLGLMQQIGAVPSPQPYVSDSSKQNTRAGKLES